MDPMGYTSHTLYTTIVTKQSMYIYNSNQFKAKVETYMRLEFQR